MSQTIVLKNRKKSVDFVCQDGTVEITKNDHIVIDYDELMRCIHKFVMDEYNLDINV